MMDGVSKISKYHIQTLRLDLVHTDASARSAHAFSIAGSAYHAIRQRLGKALRLCEKRSTDMYSRDIVLAGKSSRHTGLSKTAVTLHWGGCSACGVGAGLEVASWNISGVGRIYRIARSGSCARKPTLDVNFERCLDYTDDLSYDKKNQKQGS